MRRLTSLTLAPTLFNLRQGESATLTATAGFDDGSSADISGAVQWSLTPTGVADVTTASGVTTLSALTAGVAQLTANSGAFTSNAAAINVGGGDAGSGDAGTPGPREVRAVWVTRFAYNSQAEVRGIIDRAAAGGFNTVYFQIRGNGDAYYRSSLLPWAKKLTGTLGKDPGWDPLQVAIDAAHANGVQLHAYWNVFAAWPVPAGCASSSCACTPTGSGADCALPEASVAGAPEHYLRAHPESMTVNASGQSVDTEYYWFSPGDPAVRAHILAAATELLTRYDVDGLHLDRIRYPGPSYSYDAASNAAYAALPLPKPSREDWQRENVSKTVGAIYDALKQLRPRAVLSASVWGIYKPLPGCSTSQGFGNYFQDSLGWMATGRIDAITPMIYWDIGSGCTDWAKLLDGFLAGAAGRPVIAGMHVLDNLTPQPARISARVTLARQKGALGTSMFASTYLEQAPLGGAAGSTTWPALRATVFAQDAGVPPITWR